MKHRFGGGQQKGPPQKMSAPEYARLVSQGNLAARDRFGMPLARGQLVEYRPELLGMAALIFQVMDVTPVMDPKLPGMVRVSLQGMANLTLQVNVACHALRYHGEAHVPTPSEVPQPEAVGGNGKGLLDDHPKPSSPIVLTDATGHRELDGPPDEDPPPPTDIDVDEIARDMELEDGFDAEGPPPPSDEDNILPDPDKED
jgi:hypothetical protein